MLNLNISYGAQIFSGLDNHKIALHHPKFISYLIFALGGYMVFSSISFLFYFLPILLFVYYIVPNKFKNLIILAASLLFYAWGEVRYVFIMLFLSVVDYVCGRCIDKHIHNQRKMKIFMLIDVCTNLGILIFFKYSDFFIMNINALLGLHLSLLNIPLPIGVSFNTFQSISYIIDVYRGTTTSEKSYYNYLTYTTLFPQIIAGPIVRYVTVENELDERTIKLENFSKGLRRFLLGLGKKVLIANNVGVLWNIIQTGAAGEMSVVIYWVGIIAFTFQIYFDFSGYSDMAIGLAEMFGLTFDENFNYPYISNSITEFWRRWHMTLSAWFKDYVYIPLGGNRKGKLMQTRNIFIVWALTGFWHGASWNFILWGLYFAVILMFEKFVLFRFWEKVFKPIRHIYTMLLVLFSWVIFAVEDLTKIGNYFKGMFGLENVVFINNQALYYISQYAVIFVIAAILATPFLKKKLYNMEQSINKMTQIAVVGFYVFLLLASTAYLVNSTYNPFLYFRF